MVRLVSSSWFVVNSMQKLTYAYSLSERIIPVSNANAEASRIAGAFSTGLAPFSMIVLLRLSKSLQAIHVN